MKRRKPKRGRQPDLPTDPPPRQGLDLAALGHAYRAGAAKAADRSRAKRGRQWMRRRE